MFLFRISQGVEACLACRSGRGILALVGSRGMRWILCLLVVVVALVSVGCATAPTSTVVVNPSNADLECIEVFDAGPIR